VFPAQPVRRQPRVIGFPPRRYRVQVGHVGRDPAPELPPVPGMAVAGDHGGDAGQRRQRGEPAPVVAERIR